MATEVFIDKANLVLQTAANHPFLAVLVYLASMAISRVWHSARFAECWYQLTGGLLGRMLVDVASVVAWPLKLIIAYMALFWRMLISFGYEMPTDSAQCQPPGPPPPEVDQPRDLATEDARLVKEVTDADAQLQQHSVENAALIEEITKLKERDNLKEAQTEQHSAENARLTEEVASLKEKLRKYEKTERSIASFQTKVAKVPEPRLIRRLNYNMIPKNRQYGIFHVSEGRVLQPPNEATKKQLSLSKILTVVDTTPIIAAPIVSDNAPANIAPVRSYSSILIVADTAPIIATPVLSCTGILTVTDDAPVNVAPRLSLTNVFTVTDNAPIATIEPAIPASDVVPIDEDSAREDELNDNVHEEAQNEVKTEKEENQVTKSDKNHEVERQQEHEDEDKTNDEDERDQDAKKDDDGDDDDDKDDDHDLGGGGAVLMLPDHPLSASSIPAPPEQPAIPGTNVFEQVHTPSTELPVPALPTLALRSPATHKRRLSDPEEPQRSGHGPASRPIPTESSTLPSVSSSATVASALVTAQLPAFGNAPGSSATIAPNAQIDDNEAMEVVETQPSDKTEGLEKDSGYLMDGVVGEPTVAVERVAETHDGSMDGVIQQAPPVATVGINNVHGDAMEVIEVETNQDARNMMEGVTQFETTTRDDQEMADDIGSTQDFNMHQYTDRDMHDNFSGVTPAVEIVDTDMQNDALFAYTPRQPATQVAIDREIEMDVLEDLRPELPATPGEFGPIDEIFDQTFVEAGPSSTPLILSPTIPDEFYAHPPPMPLRVPSPDPLDDLYSLPPSTPPRSPSPDLLDDIYSPPPPPPRRSALPSAPVAPVHEQDSQTQETGTESVAGPADPVSEETAERHEQTRTGTTTEASTGPRVAQQHSYTLTLPLQPSASRPSPDTPMTPTPNPQSAAGGPSSVPPRRIIRKAPRPDPLRPLRTTKPSAQTQKSKDTSCAKLGPDGRVIRSPAARPPEAPKTPTSVKVLAPKRNGSAADPNDAPPDAPRIAIFSISDPLPAPASDPQQPSQATGRSSNRAQAKEKRNQEQAVQTGDTPTPTWFSQTRQILPLPRSNRANRSAEDIADHQQRVYEARRELEQELAASESQEAAGGEDGHRDRIVRVGERAEQNQSDSVFTYGGAATRDERLGVLCLLFDILGRRSQDTGTARKFKRWGGQRRLKLLSKERWQDLPGAPEDQKTFLTREQVNDLLGRWMRYLLEGLVQQDIVYADEMEGVLREWMRMVEEERRSQPQ
ncbi:hypothetical protein CGLO_11792 [Colletotrichum gloeosporioides Cg-14]|uniref:Uncharacterized protein n=1 Tax=Colletotrichum gloeosporioides (strain Cg-14) TaxID=1237896 RepID=T0LAW1_COLGC|nr:hypothetical protein CGLO_11792 [Colletotrichum gloeosporioides Cg-14]